MEQNSAWEAIGRFTAPVGAENDRPGTAALLLAELGRASLQVPDDGGHTVGAAR
jgi:hypothetical protein